MPTTSAPTGATAVSRRQIAYFSMEIGVDPSVPTYCGGLGILAGDCMRSAADLALPMVGVTLIHRKGYFFQKLGPGGSQTEEPVQWSVADFLVQESPRVRVTIEGRTVALAIWRYSVTGCTGATVPVYFLDADLPENAAEDRHLTDELYGGDHRYRLHQEIILGIGGVRALRALGLGDLRKFHMNEGHAAFLTLELYSELSLKAGATSIAADQAKPGQSQHARLVQSVRDLCAFTTHTPLAAGHDRFTLEEIRRGLGEHPALTPDSPYCAGGSLNLTSLAVAMSRFVNAVSIRHADVSRRLLAPPGAALLPGVEAITNGVHASTWVSRPMQSLFDRHCPGWRRDEAQLRTALAIPDEELWHAHREAKKHLMNFVNAESNLGFDVDYFTIGFARRATGYKRADLLFSDPERLRFLAREVGPIQLVFGGKAHPRDGGGKDIIRRIHAIMHDLRDDIRGVYLPNYDFDVARKLISGVDLWLNTPIAPLEASGTSGMKAAMNGIPSLSSLDGWWLEGCFEGLTGWAVGTDEAKDHLGGPVVEDRPRDAASLYQKLSTAIMPTFYTAPAKWIGVMRHAIALNGSYFNTGRVMRQYAERAYAGM
jgi:starch phosphorylase